MARIDYYFATVSPYVYLAGTRLEQIAVRHGATIAYHPVDPVSVFARTGGLPLAQRHDSRKAYRQQDLRRQSAMLGMALNMAPLHWPVNPAPSAYAILAAGRSGADVGGLVHAFARACWAEERNIADDDTIRTILAENGLDPALADKGLLASAETYAANLEDAVAKGVFGVPFYVVGTECFWGQDRLEELDLYLAGKL
jgi:2-hydroxychromene-2-carboxylate isomerase